MTNTCPKNYRRFYLNDSKSRWIHVDSLGKKDVITLQTTTGKLETRTCQYWGNFLTAKDKKFQHIEKCKITYKGKTFFVTRDTVLEA